MKLLIITQVVDKEHPFLGFFHRWIEEFSKHCEQVHVICLQKGKYDFPKNVTVYSLGKEESKRKLIYLINFYKLIWRLRHEYDNVFVHMNQIYVILGALILKLNNKKISLWYVHRNISLSLRLATILTDKVFSSTKDSFRIRTSKVNFVGHGIDIEKFKQKSEFNTASEFTVAHVGRITRIKNLDILIEAVSKLEKIDSYKFLLFGSTVTTDDIVYKNELLQLISKFGLEDKIIFKGAVTNEDLLILLPTFDLTINLTPTGGMDKAVLESAASGVPVITSNYTFKDFLGEYNSILGVRFNDSADLAKKIEAVKNLNVSEQEILSKFMIEKSKEFDIKNLIPNIIQNLK